MCEMAKAREGASRGEPHSKKWRENKRAIKMLGERRTETGSLLPCDLRLAGPVISPSLWDNGLGCSSCFPQLSSISQPTKSQRPQCAVWLLRVCVCECKPCPSISAHLILYKTGVELIISLNLEREPLSERLRPRSRGSAGLRLLSAAIFRRTVICEPWIISSG